MQNLEDWKYKNRMVGIMKNLSYISFHRTDLGLGSIVNMEEA